MSATFKLRKEDYISVLPENYILMDLPSIKLEIYKYTSRHSGEPCVMAFSGKQNKPFLHTAYFGTEQQSKAIDELIERAEHRRVEKIKRAEEQKAPTTLKVGDIMYDSWGYDQTNVDFYQVTAVLSPRTVEIREIGAENFDYQSHGMACQTRPIPDSFRDGAPTLKKRVTMDCIRISQSIVLSKWGEVSDDHSTYRSWYA